MQRGFVATIVATFALAGCQTAQVESDLPSAAPPPAGAEQAIVPNNTELVVELDQTLSADQHDKGDTFTASVKDDVQVGGEVVVPAGSKVTGRITGVDKAEGIGDQAALRIAFESIEVNGRTHEFSAEVTDVDVSVGERATTGETVEKAGVGAAAGAVIGAVIGGSLKDILIGGALGAGAGSIISLGMGDVASALPEGTDLRVRTTRSVAMR